MHGTIITVAAWLVSLAAATVQEVGTALPEDRAMKIADEVTDKRLTPAERDTALSALENLDFDLALSVAPALLSETDRILRARAAWILAQGNQASGRDVLRAMAGETTDESLLAIEALGRLHDAAAHDELRGALRQELAREKPGAGRVSALTQALGDYADKSDAALVAMAIKGRYGSGAWVMIEAVGRTGGSAAVPVLEDIFSRGKGWTVMAAGLGLARCGSEKGLAYVRGRLADRSGDPNKPNESYPTNAETDDPNGPKAADFILTHLGVQADEVFVPDLLRIISAPEYSWRAKALAWQALVRINPASHRNELLDLAWRTLGSEGAARFVVLNDEDKARQSLAGTRPEQESYEQATLRHALSATPRERRRWREVHGYSF